MRLRRPGGLWRHPEFMKLWTGQSVSVFGSLVGGTALDFTAILVLEATPFQKALLFAAGHVPAVLGGVVAGVWVDRLPRRSLLIAADLGRAVVLLSIPVVALRGALRIELLYAVAFLTSLLTLVFDVAYQSYLPSLVGRDQLVEGNSKLSASASVAEVGGFGLAGWLVQVFTAPITILIDAVSFLFSAGMVLAIRARETRRPPHSTYRAGGTERSAAMLPEAVEPGAGAPGTAPLRSSWWLEAREGLRVVWHEPVLRALILALTLNDLAGGIMGALIVLYMVREVGFAPGLLTSIWAVGGLSSLLGAFVAGPAARRFGVGPVMVGGLLLTGVGTMLVPLASGATLLAAGLLIANQVITDPSDTVFRINELSLRQSLVPERLLGRVSATFRMVALGMALIGALAGGVLGELVGTRAVLFAGVGLIILAAAVLARSPVMRVRSLP